MEKIPIQGPIYIIDISDELELFMDELLDKNNPNVEKDFLLTFFDYLIRTIFNTNLWNEVSYVTHDDAICTIDDTVGKILSDTTDIPEVENKVVSDKLTSLQTKLTLSYCDIINSVSKTVTNKIYNTYVFKDKPITITREDSLVLVKIDLIYKYEWSIDKFIKRASVHINMVI